MMETLARVLQRKPSGNPWRDFVWRMTIGCTGAGCIIAAAVALQI